MSKAVSAVKKSSSKQVSKPKAIKSKEVPLLTRPSLELVMDEMTFEEEEVDLGADEEEMEGEERLFVTLPDGTTQEVQKEVLLTKEMIRQGLSMIGRTVDNFQYAYIRYDGSNRNVSNVDALADYVHLRVLIISENRIRSLLPLCSLKHLLVLNAHTNVIESFEEIPTWPYLQALSLMSNRLTSLKGLYANHIVYIQLSFNGFDKLEDFNGSTFYALRTLELRGNQLKSLEGLSIPTLEHLFAAQNSLSEISGFNCPNLVTLHLRDNEIKKLENFPLLPNLKYLNLRSNLVSRFTQTVSLDKAPSLTILVFVDNPISGSEVYRSEMLAVLPLLTRIDKVLCTEEEMIAGRQLKVGREKNVEGVRPLEDDPNVITPFPTARNLRASLEDIENDEEEEGDVENEVETKTEPAADPPVGSTKPILSTTTPKPN